MNKHTHAMFASAAEAERQQDIEAGRDARRRCVPHNCNPYRKGTVSHEAWSAGWDIEDSWMHYAALRDDAPEAFMLMRHYGGPSYDISGPYPSIAEAQLACTDACDEEIEEGRRYSSRDGRWVIYPAGENERVIARIADGIVTELNEDAAEAAWERSHGG